MARNVLAQAEAAIAEGLARLVRRRRRWPANGPSRAPSKGLDDGAGGAVALAAAHGVSLLTGGPGTGKSRTVAAIVALCRKVDASIALAAPTGRAAKRLEELAGNNATTVHRLLGARPPAPGGDRVRSFDHDADNPIEAELVVVDEASMLDVELAAALISALPDGTHLVIVGDPAQLPSIGPGRVLGDLIDSGTVPVTELSTLYRQTEGGTIARLAIAVRAGDLVRGRRSDPRGRRRAGPRLGGGGPPGGAAGHRLDPPGVRVRGRPGAGGHAGAPRSGRHPGAEPGAEGAC